jgi:hypothetical protein
MTHDPQTRFSPKLVLYGLAFRILRAAWGLGGGAGLPACRLECASTPELPGPARHQLEWDAVHGSPARPKGV